MDTKNLQLDETQRIQLDGIVSKMVANKESDSNIQFVVNDFKEKYATKPPGFFQNIAQGAVNIGKDIIGLEQNKSQAFIPSLIQNTIGSKGLAGVAQLPGRVIFSAMNPEDPNAITASQAIGTTGNALLTAGTGGASSVAKSAGLTGAKALVARAAENAVVGGAFQASSNLANNKPITEGVGVSSLVSGAIPLAGSAITNTGKGILNKAAPTAETFINSLIKPLGKDFSYGKNPARGIINEGIVAKDINDLGQKVSQKIDVVGKEIGDVGSILDKSGVTLNLVPALDPINKAIDKAARANNTGLFNSLNNVKVALLNDLKAGVDEKGMPVITQGDAKNLITAGYNEAKQFLSDISTHTRFTGNPSDDKALNMATKQAYGITREIMNTTADKVDANLGKQIRNLNERYSDLLSANNAINHREIVLKRQNFLNLADKYSLPIAVGGAVATGLITGDFTKAGAVLLSELGAIGATKVLGSTYSKTRIAQFLSKLPPAERQGILNSTPILKNWYERVTGQSSPNESKIVKSTNNSKGSAQLGLVTSVAGLTGAIGSTQIPRKITYIGDNSKPQTIEIKGNTQQGEFTSYNPESKQTDNTPLIMASGKKVYDGAIATGDRSIPFGTKIYVPELNRVFTVEDRMNIRYSPDKYGKQVFDIVTPTASNKDKKSSKDFGRQQLHFIRLDK